MKECDFESCSNPQFGGGYCARHQWMRTDKKPKGIKRTRIKVKKTKTGEYDLFKEIYRLGPRTSFISAISLEQYTGKLWINLFAHVIPKNGHIKLIFPDKETKDILLRLNKNNIVMLTPYEHYLFDHGTEEQREKYATESREHGIFVDWNRLYRLRDSLIEQITNELQSR